MIKKREYSITELNKFDRKVLEKYTKISIGNHSTSVNTSEENKNTK